MSRSWHGRDKNRPMVKAWLSRDKAKLSRKLAKADKLETPQDLYDAAVEEIVARAVHCYIDEKGDVRVVAA